MIKTLLIAMYVSCPGNTTVTVAAAVKTPTFSKAAIQSLVRLTKLKIEEESSCTVVNYDVREDKK